MENVFEKLLGLASGNAAEEPWSVAPDGGVIWIRRATREELPELYAITKRELGDDIASLEVTGRVFDKNADSIWSVYRASDNTRADPVLVGLCAFLHLNQRGVECLEAGTFDASDPDMELIAPTAARPAAIYVWAMVARKVSLVTAWLAVNALGADMFRSIPIYSTAATMGGLNVLKSYGFTAHRRNDAVIGELLRLDCRALAVTSSGSAPMEFYPR